MNLDFHLRIFLRKIEFSRNIKGSKKDEPRDKLTTSRETLIDYCKKQSNSVVYTLNFRDQRYCSVESTTMFLLTLTHVWAIVKCSCENIADIICRMTDRKRIHQECVRQFDRIAF